MITSDSVYGNDKNTVFGAWSNILPWPITIRLVAIYAGFRATKAFYRAYKTEKQRGLMKDDVFSFTYVFNLKINREI